MRIYLKFFLVTIIILLVAFIIALYSDINDLFKLDTFSVFIIVPSIFISAIFYGCYVKKHLFTISSIIILILSAYLSAKNIEGIAYAIGIYSAFIYLPLIILGMMTFTFLREYKIKKGTYGIIK